VKWGLFLRELLQEFLIIFLHWIIYKFSKHDDRVPVKCKRCLIGQISNGADRVRELADFC
jgi:hypothetical protein